MLNKAHQETKLPLRAMLPFQLPFVLGKEEVMVFSLFFKTIQCALHTLSLFLLLILSLLQSWRRVEWIASANIRTAKNSTRSGRRRLLCRSFLCRLCPPNGEGPVLLKTCWLPLALSHLPLRGVFSSIPQAQATVSVRTLDYSQKNEKSLSVSLFLELDGSGPSKHLSHAAYLPTRLTISPQFMLPPSQVNHPMLWPKNLALISTYLLYSGQF